MTGLWQAIPSRESERRIAAAGTRCHDKPMLQLPPDIDGIAIPDRPAIAALRVVLRPHVRATPVHERRDFGPLAGTCLQFKFELLQVSGTFKARGAFSNMLALDDAQRAAGVTAISAGNHAVAVACAARQLGIPAKVVMLKTANPARVALVRGFGAELLLAEDGAAGFAMVRDIEAREGKYFVHPFNGLRTVLGTATLGAEWAEQCAAPGFSGLDAVVLPIGGGGLAAGVATAFKLARPDIAVYGVEPEGADGMAQSFATGGPIKMGPMHGIADSLMAPHTEAYSYGLCRASIDALVTVNDDDLRAAMRLLFAELKIAVEPACAAATAAVLGPLRERLAGQRVGVLLCGSNTDPETFMRHNG
jgi:threonine dehydratase